MSDNLKETIKFLFSLLTFSVIVQGMYYIFYYSGEAFIFSNEQIEDFRMHGKPFVYFSLSILQIIWLIYIPYVIKKLHIFDPQNLSLNFDERRRNKQQNSDAAERIENIFNINLRPGGYYSVKGYLLNKNDGGWDGFSRRYRQSSKRLSVLGVKRKGEDNLANLVKKIKKKYFLIGSIMFIFPIINLLINLIYIIQYSLPLDLPIPDAWLNWFESIVIWLERLWKNPVLAIAICSIEIVIAMYIYYNMFGVPSPIHFLKSILSKF